MTVISPIEEAYKGALLDELFAILGSHSSFQPEFARIMPHWAGLNHACLKELQSHPSFKSITIDLQKVKTFSAALLQLLRTYHVEFELWHAADYGESGENPLKGFDRVSRAAEELERIYEWARVAKNATAGKKLGRQSQAFRNKARQAAVDELGHIWLLFTGKRPMRRYENPGSTPRPQPYGPFHDFVVRAIPPLFGKTGATGIDSVIRATCQHMAKTPAPEAPSYLHMR
ncbi:MAG TPA: hypothetical protein VFC56_02755 [Stellaceae bacterium]|nr:hypothetical protein [Stellaceae bacterium]